MPLIKNVSGEDRIVPYLDGRLVLAGQEVEVGEGDVFAFTCQPANWEPADAAARAEHDDEVKPAGEPAGNAAREKWAAYVVRAGLASEAEIADMSRDEIRDHYRAEVQA